MSRGRRPSRPTPAPTPRRPAPEPFELLITAVVRVQPGRDGSAILAPFEAVAWLDQVPLPDLAIWKLNRAAPAREAMAELSDALADALQEEARLLAGRPRDRADAQTTG